MWGGASSGWGNSERWIEAVADRKLRREPPERDVRYYRLSTGKEEELLCVAHSSVILKDSVLQTLSDLGRTPL